MAIKVGEIFVSLGLNTASFTKNLNDAKKLAFGNSKEIERSFKIIGTAVAGMAVAAGAALLAMGKSTMTLAAHLLDLTKQTGVSVEFLDKLRQAGEKTGADIDSLAKVMAKLAKAAVESESGDRSKIEAFRALGVSTRDAAGNLRSVESVAVDVVKALGRMGDGAAKTTILTRLGGKAGAEAAAALDELAKSYDSLTAKITTQFAKASKEHSDRWIEIKENIRGAIVELDDFLGVQELFSKAAATIKHGLRSNEMRAQEHAALLEAASQANMFPAGIAAGFEAGERALARLRAETILTGEAKLKAQEKIADFTQGLREEIGVLKIGADGMQLLRLKTLGASEGQLELVSGLQATVATLKRLETLQASLNKLVRVIPPPVEFQTIPGLPEKSITVSILTNAEKLRPPEELLTDFSNLQGYAEAAAKAIKELGLDVLKIPVKPVTELAKSMKQFAKSSAEAFGEWLISGGSFRQMLKFILQDLARMVFELLVIRNLMRIFGAFGGASGGAAGTASVGEGGVGYAAGGRITPRGFGGAAFRGMPFLVGERGPELFMPDTSGMIIPNHKLGFGGGMGGAVTIINNIDNRGADIGTTVKTAALINKMSLEQYTRMLLDRQARTA
jgi:hypothetical protein